MTKKIVSMKIDPPGGWKYGFPKTLPDPRPENIKEWLVQNGYPQKEIDSYGKYFYCRFWEDTMHVIEAKCLGEKWRDVCDDWECAGGCKHEKES